MALEKSEPRTARKKPTADIGFWFPRPERGARLAQELRKRGCRVTIYHSKPIPGDQACVRMVPYHWGYGLKILMGTSHDVYYTSRSFLPVLQLCVNRYIRGRPCVYTLNAPIWAYFSERGAQTWMRAIGGSLIYPLLLRISTWGAGAIVTNSRFLSRSLSKRLASQSHKIKPIYNGIDFEAIRFGNAKPEAWHTGRPRILSVATANFKRKADGILLLLNAFQLISDQFPDATFLMAVKCDSAEKVSAIIDYMKRLPSFQRIRLDVNRNDIPDLLATGDLFLYATPPDSSDSLPRVLIEAQAAGIPTIATDTVGCGEAVIDGFTGRIVPYEHEALASAAMQMIRNRAKACDMANVGKNLVSEKFQWSNMAKSYESLFFQVSNSRTRV